jgi:hypothetical protein
MHDDRLHDHSNMEAMQLLNERTVRRLKRLKPVELVQCKCKCVLVKILRCRLNPLEHATTMHSRHQILGHTSGHSFRHLVIVVVV